MRVITTILALSFFALTASAVENCRFSLSATPNESTKKPIVSYSYIAESGETIRAKNPRIKPTFEADRRIFVPAAGRELVMKLAPNYFLEEFPVEAFGTGAKGRFNREHTIYQFTDWNRAVVFAYKSSNVGDKRILLNFELALSVRMPWSTNKHMRTYGILFDSVEHLATWVQTNSDAESAQAILSSLQK